MGVIETATNYARARAFEYRVRDDMASKGWVAVRSPASKTPVDVYCIGWHRCVFIQCKTDGRLGTDEWNRFLELCESVDAVPVLASKGRNGRGIDYQRIVGRKTKRGVRPMEVWTPESGGRREVQGT